MKVKQNIGILNALLRITCGLTLLSWATAKMVKRPWDGSYLVTALLAAMKVSEGIVRFCPLTALYQQGQEARQNQNDKEFEEMIPYNPT
ncbi:DUF2892 domain-containing protein [Bacillus sp. B15-48]|uniref:YgaP family membrane protein n=1 Tax=Bacillus sp. B15-48 TaxID=1548601 RepID=UPI00193F4C71|nr:DUF2892 domain-containing protein [Bacillus sp. B15-48]MBM4764552.1 DUF2892 domain-containing protein [Bacillus sp. B15-48]